MVACEPLTASWSLRLHMQDCPHPQPKTARVGEIGWGVPQLSDNSLLNTGHQIMVRVQTLVFKHFPSTYELCSVHTLPQLKEFRQAAEDRHTHLYQNPYYPPQPTSDRHTLSPPKEVRIHVAAESQQSNEECRSEHSTHSLHSKA